MNSVLRRGHQSASTNQEGGPSGCRGTRWHRIAVASSCRAMKRELGSVGSVPSHARLQTSKKSTCLRLLSCCRMQVNRAKRCEASVVLTSLCRPEKSNTTPSTRVFDSIYFSFEGVSRAGNHPCVIGLQVWRQGIEGKLVRMLLHPDGISFRFGVIPLPVLAPRRQNYGQVSGDEVLSMGTSVRSESNPSGCCTPAVH